MASEATRKSKPLLVSLKRAASQLFSFIRCYVPLRNYAAMSRQQEHVEAELGLLMGDPMQTGIDV